mmetsp:Transcript_125006/g.241095  ORF Transcript_125006/g.241095 Transcript_125006/m.241095 type:complete len:114 (-) Transcript_125006:106-447(-)
MLGAAVLLMLGGIVALLVSAMGAPANTDGHSTQAERTAAPSMLLAAENGKGTAQPSAINLEEAQQSTLMDFILAGGMLLGGVALCLARCGFCGKTAQDCASCFDCIWDLIRKK